MHGQLSDRQSPDLPLPEHDCRRVLSAGESADQSDDQFLPVLVHRTVQPICRFLEDLVQGPQLERGLADWLPVWTGPGRWTVGPAVLWRRLPTSNRIAADHGSGGFAERAGPAIKHVSGRSGPRLLSQNDGPGA